MRRSACWIVLVLVSGTPAFSSGVVLEPIAKLTLTDDSGPHLLGSYLALDGGGAYAGAPLYSRFGSRQGAGFLYDAATGEFVIDTPRNLARKEWIGNAANHGQVATVFAQLQIPHTDASGAAEMESYGVHAFLVPIRSADGCPMPRVRIQDGGEKMGLNGVDNGRLWFDQVRIPRDNLLDRFASVSEDGVYESPIPSEGRRFFTMLSTLVGGRIAVGSGGNSAAKVGRTAPRCPSSTTSRTSGGSSRSLPRPTACTSPSPSCARTSRRLAPATTSRRSRRAPTRARRSRPGTAPRRSRRPAKPAAARATSGKTASPLTSGTPTSSPRSRATTRCCSSRSRRGCSPTTPRSSRTSRPLARCATRAPAGEDATQSFGSGVDVQISVEVNQAVNPNMPPNGQRVTVGVLVPRQRSGSN